MTAFINPHLSYCFLTTHPSQFVLPGSDGTSDAGAFEATVALRHLLQVLLVIVLSVEELLPLQDLRSDGTVVFFIQLLLEGHFALQCKLLLSGVGCVNG